MMVAETRSPWTKQLGGKIEEQQIIAANCVRREGEARNRKGEGERKCRGKEALRCERVTAWRWVIPSGAETPRLHRHGEDGGAVLCAVGEARVDCVEADERPRGVVHRHQRALIRDLRASRDSLAPTNSHAEQGWGSRKEMMDEWHVYGLLAKGSAARSRACFGQGSFRGRLCSKCDCNLAYQQVSAISSA
eukprot:6183374-Pleurochrysis_carterae.AAC.2